MLKKVEAQTQEVRKSFELEKKAKRDLEKLNETKDQFIMMTQHNLRTPVTTIHHEIESILSNNNSSISPEVKLTLENSMSSIQNLNKMVDDFLNITTLKPGSQILNLTKGNIKQIIEGAVKDLRIDLEQKNITVNYQEYPESWPNITMDENKMRQVIQIIIENAVKYNFQNGNINVSTISGNDYFKLKIENTGVGITQDEKNNIFEKLFYRSKKAQLSNPIGMGIGLSVSRAIINAHHGQIYIHSNGEGQGAMVEIILPINFTSF